MFDFVRIKTSTKETRAGSQITIYPEFIVGRSKDLMVRGGSFYAVWDEETGMWSTDIGTVMRVVDDALLEKQRQFPETVNIRVMDMATFSTKKWSEFLSYCSSLPDYFHQLDSTVTFRDDKVAKEDYVSKRLGYSLEDRVPEAYDELMSTLYDPFEREKLEWAIGSIVAGDSKDIQKFFVLFGDSGTGKSTVLNIIAKLFDGYWAPFEAKAMGGGYAFALEIFRSNPLVSIDHDGDLSRIEDNTTLNSVVSHETMVMNEKRKSLYSARFNTLLFIGTNRPVKITDSKSGILRRLIDIRPSGRTLPYDDYMRLIHQIDFELGAIANHCLRVYSNLGIDAYSRYRPLEMMSATNDLYNFVEDHYDIFAKVNSISLTELWSLYRKWCEDAGVHYPMSRRVFKFEMRNYFDTFKERCREGTSFRRSMFFGFKKSKFAYLDVRSRIEEQTKPAVYDEELILDTHKSIFDADYQEQPAQYANADGIPTKRWDDVTTKLKDIDTSLEHYVRLPENHIVIDFDIPDENGGKDLHANLREASKWPTTYAELSRSGSGVHLHYIYDGDVSKLAREYADHIEIKVFTGKSALRRRLTRCNHAPIATLSSGLPLRKEGDSKVLDFDGLKNEKAIRTLIERNLRKEIHPGTKPSVDFIAKILKDAYASGIHYDVTDMRPAIMAFANNSTHHSLYCLKLVNSMEFHSDDVSEGEDWERDQILFYDVEVFLNLFVVVWKRQGGSTPVQLINPTPEEIEDICKYKLVGFNCRRYDNHILYARMLGYSNEELYKLSKAIISGSKNAMFREAYNLSYADVYDFSSKKQSLKKFEIELGIHHQELGLPWDDPVPEELWEKVAEYCVNDVEATEATFNARHQDFLARCLLADLSGLRINDTTRQHATRIIFGKDRHPQDQFVYTDLSEMFPGYKFDAGKSTYRGETPGEGGYVYSEPGMYENVITFDVRSMHPSSLIALNLFGDKYTQNFKDLVDARLAIKDKDYEKASKMLDGKLAPYLEDVEQASQLAYALKIIINSVYGLTAASFECEFKDPRNIDNIVAKRGALFMIDLKHAAQEKGYHVVHIKTDSIKIPNADPECIKFIMDFGKKYGYIFDIESKYSKLCLVNDAVYIAREQDSGEWTATGAQFAVPYVFKTLFSGAEIDFKDLCELKSVKSGSAIYLDLIEELEGSEEHKYHFVGAVGQFCPVVPGAGGGVLYWKKNDKYYSVTGTKGYLWLESETVRNLELMDKIDRSYYDRLCDEAVVTISKFGSFEEFVR